MKRLFDFTSSLLGLFFFSPLFLLIAFIIALSSKGGVFYKQKRVGKGGKDFILYKFRTMVANADTKGLLSVGIKGKDPRVTPFGYLLRKYKIDELAQLINVVKGDMSLVGPRPEVRKYVDLYTQEQSEILRVRPGITDIASIKFRNENDLLAKNPNSEEYYINEIMPQKLSLSIEYLKTRTFCSDIKIIFKTIFG